MKSTEEWSTNTYNLEMRGNAQRVRNPPGANAKLTVYYQSSFNFYKT